MTKEYTPKTFYKAVLDTKDGNTVSVLVREVGGKGMLQIAQNVPANANFIDAAVTKGFDTFGEAIDDAAELIGKLVLLGAATVNEVEQK